MELHGGNIYDKQVKIDFSININPLGIPDKVRKAASLGVELSEHYPDINKTALTNKLTEYYSINKNQLAVGGGAIEMIYTLVHMIRPKRALIIGPTFVEYERALKTTHSKYDYYFAREEDDFVVTKDVFPLLKSGKYDMVFVCNPNNPTGLLIERKRSQKFMEICREKQIITVIDECFMEFTMKDKKYSMLTDFEEYPNLVIIRAFTKIFAMPGLRLGYAISVNEELMNELNNMMPPWNVSVPAQFAGVAALQEKSFIERTKVFLTTEREWLIRQLQEVGCKVYDTKANFILFKAREGLQDDCMKQGILIRDASSFEGIPKGFYRIGIRKREDNEKLIKLLKEIM